MYLGEKKIPTTMVAPTCSEKLFNRLSFLPLYDKSLDRRPFLFWIEDIYPLVVS